MFAASAVGIAPEDPLSKLELGERPEPEPARGWEVVRVRAASLNPHDLWTLRGVGIDPDRLPITLGCDAAGVTEDGREVIVHAVIASAEAGEDETLAPDFSILSEHYEGTHAELVAVPARNLLDKPPELSFAEAACLPTAYLTAYRMLFTKGELRPGQTVLVQGAGGVLETVGEATWGHSLRSLVPGGAVVVAGATTGPNPPADLARVFFRQLRVLGATMGTRGELADLVRLLDTTGIKPLVDATFELGDARAAYARLLEGEGFGKIVLTYE